jgi:hypothetical protein
MWMPDLLKRGGTRAGTVHGGDRLPWVSNGNGEDNFAPLDAFDWQIHVYGNATPEVRALCSERKLSLQVFPWSTEARRAGLLRDALYLVRPDGYVALADAEGKASSISSYLDVRKIKVI